MIKPEKVTASSELTKFKGHLAKFAADGKVDGKEYWCTDFANKAKGPHWLELDFGAPKKFNQIQLYMYEKNNFTQLFNNFKIEYWDGTAWKTIVDKKDYVSKYMRIVNGLDKKDKYNVELPDPAPVFRFSPLSASKVRLTVSSLPDGSARVREMLVSMSGGNVAEKEKKASANALVKYPGIYCFDFGPAKIETIPGFTKVSANTVYDAGKGYGWTSAAGMLDCDRRGPGSLRRDFVVSENTGAMNTFKVKLPSGRYYLYVLSGDGVLPSPGCRLNVNGREFDVPSNDTGDFCPEIFACDAGKDGLDISMKGIGILNSLVIAPIKQWREFSEIINSITVPDTGFKKDVQPTHREKPQISDADRKQGYICYVNSLQQRIFPDTTPLPQQVNNTVEAAATPGEIEAASFAIYGVNDVADLNITLSDLKSETGELFPAKDIDLNVVRCWPQRSGHKGNAKTWSVIPELLEPFSAQDVPSGISRQFWLNFNVPENAKPGLYTGSISLKAANTPEKKLALKFKVYPFKLKDPEDYFFAMYYGGREGSGYCIDPKNKDADMTQLLDMKKHGMNSVILTFGANWSPEIAERLRYCNRLLDEAGFPKQPIPIHHQEITPELAAQIRDLVKKENLREVLFYPVDEPFNKKLDRAIEIYKKLKTVPGIRTYSTVTQNDVDKLGDTLDVRTYTIIDYAKFEPERISEECRKAGKSFWWYSNASREYPDAVRFKAGYFYWKTNSRGQAYWAYANFQDDAFNDFDAGSAEHCTVYFKGGKLFSTIQWEEIREGINDFKYIYTLEQLIKENIGKKPEECTKARKLLDDIKADTVVDLKEYQKRFGEQIAIHIKSFWGAEKFDTYRKMIAEEIISLSK
ncbi:MAG: hypothetical protein A2017_09405 [Lentisphaerae bacterium GWF2_44_16]|nr:MAG: hypothetical protein A2017_09405 [Lentisphaerae bacterium GWF2_44_16]